MRKKFSEIGPGELFIGHAGLYVKVRRPTMLVPVHPTNVVPGYCEDVNAVRIGDGECMNFPPHENFNTLR